MTDSSSYTAASSVQIVDSYFGSEINSLGNITYRGCSGSYAPQELDIIGESSLFKLYPNPSNGHVTIEYDLPSFSENELIVYTLDGREIIRLTLNGGYSIQSVDISEMESGTYLFNVLVNKHSVEVGKISIVH